jgi:hypothetical protein
MQLSYLPPLQNRRHFASMRVRAAAAGMLLLAVRSAIGDEPAVLPARPDFAVVTHAVGGYFASLPDYRAGDLVSRSHVAAALAGVEVVGWKVPNVDEIVQRALPDNSFLVMQFATPAGHRFMRKIAQDPGAYAQLDRLSSISRGQMQVRELIRWKGGDEMIRYLTTTKGGRHLGRQMADAGQGVDLNKPTGRIYTADDLVSELKRAWDASK